MRPGKRKALDKENEVGAMIDKAEKLKAAIRAKDGASFSSHQAPVQLRESALSRTQEKHGIVVQGVCAVELVDGA